MYRDSVAVDNHWYGCYVHLIKLTQFIGYLHTITFLHTHIQCHVCMHNVMYVCTMSCMYAQCRVCMPSWAPGMHNVMYVCTMSCMYVLNSAKQVRIQTNHKLLIPQLGCLYTCTIVHSTPVDRYCHTHILFIYTQYNTQYNYIHSIIHSIII